MNDLEQLLGRMFQAHPWHGIPAGDLNGMVNAYIEIVPTDPVKYELDKPSGHLRIDRPQRFSSLPPTLYGFIPQTYCGAKVGRRADERCNRQGTYGDKDPLDICILTEKVIGAGDFIAKARPIGGLRMIDGNEADDKIIAVLEADLAFGDITDLKDLRRPLVDRLIHYFGSYKQLPTDEHRKVEIAEVYDVKEAKEVIRLSVEDYRDNYGAPEDRIEQLRKILKG
ncbi:MAG: inorganic pyrophosphatase [Myxococcaceae bacterium]